MSAVLIVDDEYYVRVRVRKCVDWAALGFEQIEECGNGEEALRLLEKRPFDLAVVDISMPLMDGLTLCKNMRAMKYATQIILLTGYDKFEYARQALSYDVAEYVLKPVDGEEMTAAVQKARTRIERHAQALAQARERAALKSQADLFQRDLFFGAIFSQRYVARASMAARLCDYGIDPMREYRVLYVRAEEAAALNARDDLLEISMPAGRAWIVRTDALDDAARTCAAQGAHLGISSPHGGVPGEIHAAYREARLIACQRLLQPEIARFRYEDYIDGRDGDGTDALKAYQDAFDASMRTRDATPARDALRGAFQLFASGRFTSLTVCLFVENLVTSMLKSGLTDGAWNETALFRIHALDMMEESETLNNLIAQIDGMLDDYCARHADLSATAGALLVKKVRQLVAEHYMEDDLSVSSIAQALCMNGSYVSDAFRRGDGQTLSQYITRVRMEKAKALLTKGRASVVEVMEQVGYKDPYYFSKRFKKFFGCSPNACRLNGK